jgi:hypothetical protein
MTMTMATQQHNNQPLGLKDWRLRRSGCGVGGEGGGGGGGGGVGGEGGDRTESSQ